jgi:hypothetical protein
MQPPHLANHWHDDHPNFLPIFLPQNAVVNRGRNVALQMAEFAVPRNLFADILRLIAELRPPLLTSTA